MDGQGFKWQRGTIRGRATRGWGGSRICSNLNGIFGGQKRRLPVKRIALDHWEGFEELGHEIPLQSQAINSISITMGIQEIWALRMVSSLTHLPIVS